MTVAEKSFDTHISPVLMNSTVEGSPVGLESKEADMPLGQSRPLGQSKKEARLEAIQRKRKVPLYRALTPKRIDWSLEEEPPDLLRTVANPPSFSISLCLMVVVTAIALMLSGMMQLPVHELVNGFWSMESPFYYSPQVPVFLFCAAVFGSGVGITALTLVLIAGLCGFPVFAAGGGPDYILQPTFPYYFGMLVGCFLGFLALQDALVRKEFSGRSLMLLFGALVGVCSVHIMGTLGLLAYAMVGILPWTELPHWWMQGTGFTILWDVALTMGLFCLARLTRLGLWLILY